MRHLIDRYEAWDRRHGPHMRTFWLLAISVVVYFAVNTAVDTSNESKVLTERLAEVRSVGVTISNKRTAAICDALRILIDQQRQSQQESTKQFLEPLRAVNPAQFDRLIKEGEARTERLARARERLVCTPIPQGP